MIRRLLALSLALAPTALLAQPATPPKLLVVISVDQFSADLYAEYRPYWTGGLKRLSEGVVFPSGYQSHAATETCPGHSTILTGDRPARTGIIANNWVDQTVARPVKDVYCAEDETQRAPVGLPYLPSVKHLTVPTLGDRMKAANPASRVVSVSGKDRAAIMMGGHNTDQIWFMRPSDYAQFITLSGRTDVPAAVMRANAALDGSIAKPADPMPLSPLCATHSRPVAISATKTLGTGRFERKAGDKKLFRASPASDAATLDLAGNLIADMKLGKGPATDLIAVGVSSTDVIGHAYGTEGSEMCIQLATLDANLGKFFARLDRAGIDYAVVLTADHGGHDAVERNKQDALPDAQRIDGTVTPGTIGKAVAAEMGLPGSVLVGNDVSGDVWLDRSLPANKRAMALSKVKARYLAMPQVAAVYTAQEVAATPAPTLPADVWSLAERLHASYTPGRSGDLLVVLKPRVTPITVKSAEGGYVATHGSPWDYDRRVPILFWRKGLAGFEQPNSVETADIAPTLAAWIGLPVAKGEMDGRCLDLIAGPGDLCK